MLISSLFFFNIMGYVDFYASSAFFFINISGYPFILRITFLRPVQTGTVTGNIHIFIDLVSCPIRRNPCFLTVTPCLFMNIMGLRSFLDPRHGSPGGNNQLFVRPQVACEAMHVVIVGTKLEARHG